MKTKPLIRSLSIIIFAFMMSFFSPVHGQAAFDYSFIKLADRSTAVPDHTGNFRYFGRPAVSGGEVAFYGQATSGHKGIYTWNTWTETLVTVADMNTGIPDSTHNFTGFGHPSISSGDVAFTGTWSSSEKGIFKRATLGGSIVKVADKDTTIPGSSAKFTSFGNVSISGGVVAFYGTRLPNHKGIYKGSGAPVSKVADMNTAIPSGTGDFDGFGSGPNISGSQVAFSGWEDVFVDGIYIGNGSLAKVADETTAIPDGVGNFTSFGSPDISGSEVVFIGNGTNSQKGIYAGNGTLRTVVERDTGIPDGTGNFTDFLNYSISGEDVAFTGSGDSSQQGIYAEIDGMLDVIIDRNDPLDGKTISQLKIGPHGFDNREIVFWARFTDNSEGVFFGYPKPIPLPSAIWLFAAGLLALSGLKRKFRKK